MQQLINTPSAVLKMYYGLNAKVNFFNTKNEQNPAAYVAAALTGIALFVLTILEFVCRAIAAPFLILVDYLKERIEQKSSFKADDFHKKVENFGKSFKDWLFEGIVGGVLAPAFDLDQSDKS